MQDSGCSGTRLRLTLGEFRSAVLCARASASAAELLEHVSGLAAVSTHACPGAWRPWTGSWRALNVPRCFSIALLRLPAARLEPNWSLVVFR
eukprot:6182365-Pleurochrysis_carterae.AAC.4